MPWAIRSAWRLTPGQDHDLTGAEPLLETANPRALIGDKAYDADPLIHSLEGGPSFQRSRERPTAR